MEQDISIIMDNTIPPATSSSRQTLGKRSLAQSALETTEPSSSRRARASTAPLDQGHIGTQTQQQSDYVSFVTSGPSINAPGSTVNNVTGDQYNKHYHGLNLSEDPILADIPYAKGAAFIPEKACLPGTRASILEKIIAWVENGDSAAMLWLTGFAGAGKSAISHAIAQYFHSRGQLGSSFFFDRAHQALRRPDNLFSTIALDVARMDKAKMAYLLDIIRADQGLRTTTSPKRQFRELLVALSRINSVNSPIVIVIDALDESGDGGQRESILSVLKDGAKELQESFRFLITSRFEDDIAEALFQNPRIDMERIQDIERQSTDSDIMAMLAQRLPNIPILETHYPNGAWRCMIVDKAEGNFQWAASASLVIRGTGQRVSPLKQFQTIMATGSQLYSLYKAVLNSLFKTDDEETIETFAR